jgi:hypothetical protein
MKKFKVSFYQDNQFEVYEKVECSPSALNPHDDAEFKWKSVFIGSIADCEAYIRLKENENVQFDL